MKEPFGPRNGQKGFSDDEMTQCGADCSVAAGRGFRTGQGRESTGDMSEAGEHPVDVLPLADEVRFNGAEAGQTATGVAEGEREAEAAGSRAGLGHADPA